MWLPPIPIGGIIADRINKRNIMVILDFSTALLTLILTLLLGKVDLILLLLITMIFLYGIQGAYQPAVQASIPVLVASETIMPANAIINLISSLSGLLGPVLGGILYAAYDLMPILYISILCFLFSAIMEIFIKIPFTRTKAVGNIFSIGISDLKESFHFIRHTRPEILKVSLIIASINLLLSALIIISLPILITQTLVFPPETANRLYGYSQGSIAAGSLLGGLMAGVLSRHLKATHSPLILLISTITLLPIGLSLQFISNPNITYAVLLISCVVMMAAASLFSIQMMSYLQILTPQNLVGKVISCAICIGMCASPVGQAIYGILFDLLKEIPCLPFYFAAILVILICISSRTTFQKINQLMNQAPLE